MASLIKDLRRQLERTVVEARKIAEEGAEESLKHLAVDIPRPHDKLATEDKRFRVSLRVHAKQLGDRLDARPTRLIQAVAYEHWHRLLFARFLIENNLMLHPEHRVALSLDEVKETALGENREWVDVAADYAQRMLLRCVFQPEDPALRVPLSPEKRLQLEAKLSSLPREVFLADDSLGWVYQFWQRDEKDRVNKSEVKIGANELAPVTQLFTEDYMVFFLLENTLGAWWTGRHRKPDLPGYNWTYLRLNGDGTSAAGTFDGWPTTAKDLRILDPCMGSGHFLTFALPILARMRMAEEGLPLSEAIFSVLRDNLFGLELDPRCTQIAAFNLALASWKLAGKHFEMPQLNLACSGLGINAKEEDWVALARGDELAEETLSKLYMLFSNAPTLGSLIDPAKLSANLFAADFEKIRPLFEKALSSQESSDDVKELAIAASGVVAAARLLSRNFTLVVTNVPYLGREKHSEVLAHFADTYAADAAADMSTLMLHRCLTFLEPRGTLALVLPQNWWVGQSYKAFRKRLLRAVRFRFATVLGEEAWWSFGNRGPNTVLLIAELEVGTVDHTFAAIDVSTKPGSVVIGLEQKAAVLRGESVLGLTKQPSIIRVHQAPLAESKAARIAITEVQGGSKLSQFVTSGEGCSTGDSDRFIRCFWEVNPSDDWFRYCGPGFAGWHHCDSSMLVFWQNGEGELALSDQARMQNIEMWTQPGVLVGRVRGITATLFDGGCYSKGAVLICPNEVSDLPSIYAFLKSSEYENYVRTIDPRVSAATSILTDVPFEISEWHRIASESYPDGLPQPNHTNPTQITFDGCIETSEAPLQSAVMRLVGYKWPRQIGRQQPGCPLIPDDGLDSICDSEGVVCLTSLGGQDSAANRLRKILQSAFGTKYSLDALLKDKKSSKLEDWLLDEFFAEHSAMFDGGKGPRPVVWHVWDGLREGFHALVNYQKLSSKALEKLIYFHLGDWISRQRQAVLDGTEGAETRLAAAEHLQGELKKILAGEAPYDIFVRWKPLINQPIGWDPDLNDGIRINIRPWIKEARLYGATKPGLLRGTLNIKYGKDLGKESGRDPIEFPWFKNSRDRNNDVHFPLEEKRRARGLA